MSITPEGSMTVKVEHRGEARGIYRSQREEFWGELIYTAKASKTKQSSQEVMLDDIDLLEARIEHELGPALRAKMIRVLVEDPIVLLNENTEMSDKTGNVLHHLGYAKAPLNVDSETIVKLAREEVEYLRQRNAETPYRAVLNTRAVAASSVFFAARVIEYDGLLLELAAAPAVSLTEVFQGDVVAFKTFLESCLSEVFTGCLPSKFRLGTSKLRYTVTIPDSFASTFRPK